MLRAAVAAHPDIPKRALLLLGVDQDRGVRWEAALNPRTPLLEVAEFYVRNGRAVPSEVGGGLLARRKMEHDPTWQPLHWYW